MPLQQVEAVSDAEMTEACYAVLRTEHKRKPRPGVYYRWPPQSAVCGLPEPLQASPSHASPQLTCTEDLLVRALASNPGARHPYRPLAARLTPISALRHCIKCASLGCRKYRTWLQHGICGPEAFVLRAQIHKNAKCYLQASPQPSVSHMPAENTSRPLC